MCPDRHFWGPWFDTAVNGWFFCEENVFIGLEINEFEIFIFIHVTGFLHTSHFVFFTYHNAQLLHTQMPENMNVTIENGGRYAYALVNIIFL